MKNLQVAQTIADQIGNSAFMMIGAKNLAGSENSLHFKVGRNSKGVTHVKIELTPADLYKMTFMSIRGMNVKVKAEHDGVYADMLNRLIESETGMYTSL